MSRCRSIAALVCCVSLIGLAVRAQVVVAFSPLAGSGDTAELCATLSDIAQAELTKGGKVTLVDREQMHRLLNEMRMSDEGVVNPDSVRKIGKIVGARYFCSGSVRKVGDRTLATVRLVDVETTVTKLAYTPLAAPSEAIEAGKRLASQVQELIAAFETEKGAAGQAAAVSERKEIPPEWKRPAVMVLVREEALLQPILIDPAGETEIVKRLIADGYRVIDSEYVRLKQQEPSTARALMLNPKTAAEYAAKKDVDLLLYGEAITEQGATLGDFKSCRARVEMKAIRVKDEAVLASDSAYAGATDLSEVIAGKKAIQQAANSLMDSFSYAVAEKWQLRSHK